VDGGLPNLEKVRNLKLILSDLFRGLKINFHISELFYFGEAQDDAATYAQVMFPINNLGILIYYRRLTNAE
jgi:hypothetical protein